MGVIVTSLILLACCQSMWSFVQNPDCLLEQDPGLCKGSFTRWYYNEETNECQSFTYGGCQGNANNFMDQKQCTDQCVDICQLFPDRGSCNNNESRWYYDAARKKCKPFTYGGCEGNANNFQSKDICRDNCDPCLLPAETGPCKAVLGRWFYNKETEQCEKFIYGGCFPNENNFLTEEECSQQCEHRPERPKGCCHVYCPAGFQRMKGCSTKECRCNCPCFEYAQAVRPKKCKKLKADKRDSGSKKQSNHWGGKKTLVPICDPPEECVVQNLQTGCRGTCKDPTVYPVCPLGDQPLNNIFCGRGPSHQDCPDSHECLISPVDAFAVCCLKNACDLPPDSGCGDEDVVSWYYHPHKGCVKFLYHGLGGNGNNFLSLEDCQDACVMMP